MRVRIFAGLMLALVTGPAFGQSAITSEEPQSVEVSLYRDPSRSPDRAIDRDWPEGFALVSETRVVTLPAGQATIRFEGVASGIEPASALVRGVGIEESNQDANLLTQRGLLDHFTGQRVTLRRFDRAIGTYSEDAAIIRSGADRLIVETDAGFESVYCTGLEQTLVFDRVPEDLSAKPTLSVRVGDQPGGRYEVTLTYLAAGFDWQANYVASLNDDATTMSLRGWMTMVSADATSFTNADTNAIAGTVFRDSGDANTLRADGLQPVTYSCWPYGTTGGFQGYRLPRRRYPGVPPPPPPPPAPPPPIMMAADQSVIMVTASRVVTASREELGDLKLYRIPFPTTIAANSQKQVAFLDKDEVAGELLTIITISYSALDPMRRVFRIENTSDNGLGEPLPSGQIAFFQTAAGMRQLVGEDVTRDKAVGERIDFELGGANNVTAALTRGEWNADRVRDMTLIVHNANAMAVVVEAELVPPPDLMIERIEGRTFERDGKQVWRTTMPANGEVELRYRERERLTS